MEKIFCFFHALVNFTKEYSMEKIVYCFFRGTQHLSLWQGHGKGHGGVVWLKEALAHWMRSLGSVQVVRGV